MGVISPRRITGLSLAWAGLAMFVGGLVLWTVAYYAEDSFSAWWGGATLLGGFLVLAAGSFLLRGTRDAKGKLDAVDTE